MLARIVLQVIEPLITAVGVEDVFVPAVGHAELVVDLEGQKISAAGVIVAEQAGAYWLIDEIAINQTRPKVRAEEFQVWVLKVDLEKRNGVLSCDDGNGSVVFTKRIEYTDFPLREIRFYCTDGVILLPTEY